MLLSVSESPVDSIVASPRGKKFYLVGIKGTGMSGLAELIQHAGGQVAGSDVEEVFYTDRLLGRAGIEYHNGFDAAHIDPEIDLLVYSAAYDPSSHPELLDWLAITLRQGGYRLKSVHRVIVTSSAYRQASKFRQKAHVSV